MRFKLNRRMVFFQVPPYKRRLVASLIMIGFIVSAIVFSFWIIDYRIRPSLGEVARARARQIAVNAINNAVQSQIVPELKYGELMELKLAKDGKVAYMEPNTAVINRISAKVALTVQQRLMSLPEEKVKLPLGQVLGLRILAGYGPVVPIRVFPFGTVESSVNNHFDSAGINQVRHQIFIRIKTTVKMVVPLISEEIRVNADIPLTEAVIVGEVPGYFLDTNRVKMP